MTNKKYDIIVIGAGAIGLSFALSLAETKLNILIIDKANENKLANPEYDGRETGLTNFSVSLLKQLNIWQDIDDKYISSLKEAKVINDNSDYSLDFKSKKSHNDILGYFVSNHIIRRTLYEKVTKVSNVTILTEAEIADIENQPDLVRVILSDNRVLQGSLLVVADSRFSEARKKLGIATNMRDFARTMIVCKMKHEKSHNNIAFECFDQDRVLAVLPLSGKVSSIVVTLPISKAQDMLDMQEKDFNQDISQ